MSDTQERTPREILSRERTLRKPYQPPSTLPEPRPEPGYSYRWIATHVLGESTPTNVSQKFRGGWEPVAAKDHPELKLPANAKGNVEVGGLLLCKIPTEDLQARSDFYNTQAQAQMDSVDNHFMRNNDARMPLFKERKSETVRGGRNFGSGTK